MPETRTPIWRTLTRAGILFGIMLMLAGSAVNHVLDTATFRSATVLVPLVLGAALVGIGIVSNVRWLWARIASRKFLVGLNVWAMVTLSLMLLIVANAIVAMTPQTGRWLVDCTQNRAHTLSPKTRNILRGLDDEIAITVMMGDGVLSYGERGQVTIGNAVSDLVRLYRAESGRVKAEFVQYYREKLRAQQMAARLDDEVEADSIIVEFAGRHRTLPFREMVEVVPLVETGGGRAPFRFKGEAKLTETLLKVIEETEATVYFLAGHGELAVAGDSKEALNRFTAELGRDNYRVETLNLQQQRAIPADCKVLIIAGPRARFQDEEIELLRDYIEKGGKLLALIRPRSAQGDAAGLDNLLADYNLKIYDDEIVIAEYPELGTGRSVHSVKVVVSEFGSHPATVGLAAGTLNCLLENVCPISPVMRGATVVSQAKAGLVSPYAAVSLLRSSGKTWEVGGFDFASPSFEPGKAAEGPFVLAMAVEPREPTLGYGGAGDSSGSLRIVVIGSAMVASDEAFNQYPGNRLLLMNCVNWLARKEMKLGIPAMRLDRHELNASPSALRAIFFIVVLGMPLVGVFCGCMVWWIRRRS